MNKKERKFLKASLLRFKKKYSNSSYRMYKILLKILRAEMFRKMQSRYNWDELTMHEAWFGKQTKGNN